MSKQPPHQSYLSKSVLREVMQIARPQIYVRLKKLGNQIQAVLMRKISHKIHLKIDLKKNDLSAIEVSSIGLLALEYGRQQINGEGVLSEIVSELQSEYREVSHDE